MIFIALVLMFLSLARPQWGVEQRTSDPRGIDILIAVDVSKSMLARDVKPNRLERVKLGITNLLEKVKGDRLGLIAFSGSSFLQCPLTLDHQAFLKTLDQLEIGIIKTPGTNLALPIDEASRSFAKEDNDRFLVLLSDGEDLEGEGLKRAKIAKKDGIKIFCIGVGSESGSFIPTDPVDQPASNFLKDREGKTISTKMDSESLKNLAAVTGGKYFKLGPTGEGLAKTFDILQEEGVRRKREQFSTELPIERFQPFILFALLLLFLEILTPSAKRGILKSLIITLPFFLIGCLKQDNVKRAEEELRKGNPQAAANFYSMEVNASQIANKYIEPRLLLNAGLASLEAGFLDDAESYLEQALDASYEKPALQSIALNALGNIYYQKTNGWLDTQNVAEARKAWTQAINFYNSSIELNDNPKAVNNLKSLERQIEQRIQSLVSIIKGFIWRDLNGDGIVQSEEPTLNGKVYWDKDNNGEWNASTEPSIPTSKNGKFAFEWISGSYPSKISIASSLNENNQSGNSLLVPLFPPPPPPLNRDSSLNHSIILNSPGETTLGIPYRAAPTISGKVWLDENGNGQEDQGESGYNAVQLFLDSNGNFQLDQNETRFNPSQNGNYRQAIPPGQHSICIAPSNPDANITFPIQEKKAYFTWAEFEMSSSNLDFGIQDDSDKQNQSQDPSDSQNQEPESSQPKEQEKEPVNAEVNALYERLLQEMESKSNPLSKDGEPVQVPINGRDY